jgi:hypothetical protein
MQGIKGNKITNNMKDEDLTSWRGHRAHNQADPDLGVGIDTTRRYFIRERYSWLLRLQRLNRICTSSSASRKRCRRVLFCELRLKPTLICLIALSPIDAIFAHLSHCSVQQISWTPKVFPKRSPRDLCFNQMVSFLLSFFGLIHSYDKCITV